MQAFCGWLYGQFPPGLLANFKLAGAHLLNMFRAHTAAYNAIKELPGEHFLLPALRHIFMIGSPGCAWCTSARHDANSQLQESFEAHTCKYSAVHAHLRRLKHKHVVSCPMRQVHRCGPKRGGVLEWLAT